MKRLLAVLAMAASLAHGADAPYNEAADAKAEIRHALADARESHRSVLVVFGANWCPDCRALDIAMKSGRNAELIGKEFKVVKVDVGKFDRNLDVAQGYEVPIRKGIPAVAIVAPDNRVIYATRAGEVGDARKMSEDSLYRFFSDAANKARDK